ncbi:MAG: hypothetical protein RHS_5034 [Robinsoniella sp. RHS]|nr:MAG: hypothetical protein RHS_5034 [Robinsoniella sp. RHS]
MFVAQKLGYTTSQENILILALQSIIIISSIFSIILALAT